MSRNTKGALLKENQSMSNILVQIHNLTAPFINCIADGMPTKVNAAGKISATKKTTTGKKAASKTKGLVANRQLRSKTKQEHDTGEELLQYLRLKSVISPPDEGEAKSAYQSKHKSNDGAPILAQLNMEEMLNLKSTVTVVLDRLTPMDIAEATRGASVQRKWLITPRQQQRQHLSRKAAPINLKELSAKQLKKVLKHEC